MEGDVAVRVDRHEVAPDEPLPPDDAALLVGAPVIAEHEAGIGAVHGEQPGGPGWQGVIAVVGVLGEDGNAPPRLGTAGAARMDGGGRPGGDEGRDLAHAERLVQLEPRPLPPRGEQVGRERFARSQAVPEGAQVEGAVGCLEPLAVDAGHGREEGRAVVADEPVPRVAAAGAVEDDGARPDGPRVGEADAEGVRPAEGARVEHDVVRADAEPAVAHRPPAPGGAVGVQHALGPAGRAGGVDEEGRVVGRGVDVVGDGGRVPARVGDPRVEVGGPHDVDARWDLELEVVGEGDGPGPAVGEDEAGLVGGEHRRGRDGDETGGHRAEVGDREGARAVEAQEHTLATAQTERAKPGTDGPGGEVELGEGVVLGLVGGGVDVMDDGEADGVRTVRGRDAEAVPRHGEPLRDRLAAPPLDPQPSGSGRGHPWRRALTSGAIRPPSARPATCAWTPFMT